jgi:ubiquinone/menaquinone biosynthesis C-methylase UbiE
MIEDKKRIQKHWNTNPCGSRTSHHPKGTLEYFEQIDNYRYGYYAPWLPRVMGFNNVAGKQLLEIGVGQGSDLAMFAKHGAICTGVDITERHLELSRKRFRLLGLDGCFLISDAENLPFNDGAFDIVYSYGVLHHTPNIRAAIREIYRVLRPGGEARIMIYAKYSEFNFYTILQGLIRFQFLRYGYAATVSHWCEGTAWDNPVPVSRYSNREVMRLFSAAGFKSMKVSKHLLTRGNVPVLGRFLSDCALESLARLIGWNLVIRADK